MEHKVDWEGGLPARQYYFLGRQDACPPSVVYRVSFTEKPTEDNVIKLSSVGFLWNVIISGVAVRDARRALCLTVLSDSLLDECFEFLA